MSEILIIALCFVPLVLYIILNTNFSQENINRLFSGKVLATKQSDNESN